MADSAVEINGFVTVVTKGIILLGALNSPSPRSSFFIDPVIGERLTNPFFRLLDSPGKSAEVL
jgi:hypothetical protein